MENSIKILDCTLRDGAYLVNKCYEESFINGIISGLMDAGIDIIEVGFLQDDGNDAENVVFHNGKDAMRVIPKNKNNREFTVLADYCRYSIDNLEENNGKTFDAVRACFFRHERREVIPFCKRILEKGYALYVQPVDILGYAEQELLELIEQVNQLSAECFSIVDTFGSMYVDDLERVFKLVHSYLKPNIAIGFHSHNNIQLSNALSQKVIELAEQKRNVIIDATLSGMGRGAGNTPLELIVQFLLCKGKSKRYNVEAILETIDSYIGELAGSVSWGYSTPYFITGSCSAHVNNAAYLKGKYNLSSLEIMKIIQHLDENDRKRYFYEILDALHSLYVADDFI